LPAPANPVPHPAYYYSHVQPRRNCHCPRRSGHRPSPARRERTFLVRSGGSGPVVVLLHGYAETSDSWAPRAVELAKTCTVVVPDLRGIGRSSRPAGGSTRRRRPRTSGRSSRRSGTTVHPWFPTTSALWSPTHTRRAIRKKSSALSSWTRPSQVSRPGMTSCEIGAVAFLLQQAEGAISL